MADLREIVTFLDRELKTSEIRDYPGALNGLQLENDGTVNRVISAVDASLAVIEEAAREGGLLLVHHGMFWQGAQKITGPYFQKLKAAMDGNLAIYSSHLPLDFHPEIGNNILLARAIGLKSIQPILPKDGFASAVAGEWYGTRNDLQKAIENAVDRPLHICACGSEMPRKVAVMTGGAGSEVGKIAELGLDSFITGEGPHWSFIEAEERRMNVFYSGHYATETFGVKALGNLIAEKFNLKTTFLSRSGGL
ncbi:MAG: Nif3-like dinuclear metal center hexameric protein [Verrucomicrobiota bacterium]